MLTMPIFSVSFFYFASYLCFNISTMLLALTSSFHNREAKGKAGGMDQD